MSAYAKLTDYHQQLSQLQEIQAISSWDEACMMPTGSGDRRGQAMAALARTIHAQASAPELGDLLDLARAESLDAWQRANLGDMTRNWKIARALPMDLVSSLSITTSRCEQAWRQARAANDWPAIVPLLEEVVSLSRQRAAILADTLQLPAYDALLDTYEPALRTSDVNAEFESLKTFLPPLLDQILGRQSAPIPLPGPFPVEAQRQLCQNVMELLGFDFNRGRFDVSHHPFCGGVPDDTRITTRYDEKVFLESLMAICHETGHALYQQGLPADMRGQPVGNSLGAAVHESQSLLMELQVCRSRDFISFLAPQIAAAFGGAEGDPAWGAENLYQHATHVEQSLIRVQADEVTYPLHVILRYELEAQLISGELPVARLPEAWDDAMTRYLGVSTGNDYANGCMQDVHWFAGLFGYFPTYTLGALAAAQWFATAKQQDPEILSGISEGRLAPLLTWLRSNVHGKGRLLTMQPLLREVTGSELNADYFRRHLETRYLN